MQERFLDIGAGVVDLRGVRTTHREERRGRWFRRYPCLIVNYTDDETNEYEFIFSSRSECAGAHEKLTAALTKYEQPD